VRTPATVEYFKLWIVQSPAYLGKAAEHVTILAGDEVFTITVDLVESAPAHHLESTRCFAHMQDIVLDSMGQIESGINNLISECFQFRRDVKASGQRDESRILIGNVSEHGRKRLRVLLSCCLRL